MSYALKVTVSTPVGVFAGTAGDPFDTTAAAAKFRDSLIDAGVGDIELIDDTKLIAVPTELSEVSVFTYEIIAV